MSHGGGGDDEMAEPNFTALLDLVLQMVMFFMITTSLVMEQVNADIQLPDATSAKPIDREAKNIVFLNVGKDGKLKEGGDIDSQVEIDGYMKRLYDSMVSTRGAEGIKEITIVIRGDQDTDFEHIYNIMLAAKAHNFPNIQLRANLPKKG